MNFEDSLLLAGPYFIRGGWTRVISDVTFNPYIYVYVCTHTPCRRESGVRRPSPRSCQGSSGSQKGWISSRMFLAHGTNYQLRAGNSVVYGNT